MKQCAGIIITLSFLCIIHDYLIFNNFIFYLFNFVSCRDEAAHLREQQDREYRESMEADSREERRRLQQEREAELLENERKAREEKIRVENILKGNPLLNPSASSSKSSEPVDFKVKRRSKFAMK